MSIIVESLKLLVANTQYSFDVSVSNPFSIRKVKSAPFYKDKKYKKKAP